MKKYSTLEETLAAITPLDKKAMETAQKRWDSIAKPLHSLGKLETLLIQIAGITGNPDIDFSRRAWSCGRGSDPDRPGGYGDCG